MQKKIEIHYYKNTIFSEGSNYEMQVLLDDMKNQKRQKLQNAKNL